MEKQPEPRGADGRGGDAASNGEGAEVDEEIFRSVAVHREVAIGKPELGAKGVGDLIRGDARAASSHRCDERTPENTFDDNYLLGAGEVADGRRWPAGGMSGERSVPGGGGARRRNGPGGTDDERAELERRDAAGPEDAGVGRSELERVVAARSEEEASGTVAACPEDAGVGRPEDERVVAADPENAGRPALGEGGARPESSACDRRRRRCGGGMEPPDKDEA